VPDLHLVTTRAQLSEVLTLLSTAPRIALDCESNGMHAWRGRLCLLQLAAVPRESPAAQVWVIDPFALGSLDPLLSLLSADGPVKIVHDVGFDARLLQAAGIPLGNVVDTSVMARFLGYRETGLGALLARHFGITLDKSLQRHDWARRPLGPRELAYLAGDVIDLGRLADALEAEVAALEIADEVAEETKYVLHRALTNDTDTAWWRIKGVRALTPVERAVVRALWHARDRLAERRDVPPGTILPNGALVQIARIQPTTADAVRRSGLLGRASDAEVARCLAEAVLDGLAAGDIPPDEERWFVTERSSTDRPLRRAREMALQRWRTEEAARRGVDPQVVLPGHCLADLAAIGASSLAELTRIEGLGASRIARYGEVLLDRLRAATSE
jgi:ribonuclease D